MSAAGIAGNEQLETIHLDSKGWILKEWFGTQPSVVEAYKWVSMLFITLFEISEHVMGVKPSLATTLFQQLTKQTARTAFKSCSPPTKGKQWQLLSKSPDLPRVLSSPR